MRHDETMFARWVWTPRTSATAIDAAYASQEFAARREPRSWLPFVAGLVLGFVVGVVL